MQHIKFQLHFFLQYIITETQHQKIIPWVPKKIFCFCFYSGIKDQIPSDNKYGLHDVEVEEEGQLPLIQTNS